MEELTAKWPPKTASKLSAAKHYAATQMAPYMAEMLMQGTIWKDDRVETMAVSKRGNVRTSQAFVDACDTKALGTVLLHEAMHVFLYHFRGQKYIESGACTMHQWNVAADLSINHWLDKHPKSEWPDGYPPLLPNDFGWDGGLTAEEYLQEILKQAEKEEEQGNAPGKASGQEQGEAQEGEGEKAEGSGANSSQSEQASTAPGQTKDGDQQEGAGQGAPSAPPEDKKEGGAAAGDCGSGATGMETEADRYVDEASAKTDSMVENLRRRVAEAVQEETRKKGNTQSGELGAPDFIKRLAETILEPPAVRWQDVLRRAVKKSVRGATGSPDMTHSRPNRRQGGIGWGAGRPLLKGVRRNSARVIVGVDTSGSMGTAELERAVMEVNAICKLSTTKLRFVACDTEVRAVAEVKSAREIVANLKGGGGTNFMGMFEWLDKQEGDLFIFVTDGWGRVPREAPKVETLFVSVGEGSIKPYWDYSNKPVEWGGHVTITPEGKVAR